MDSRYLPEELVILVLECLPPISALRFKSVCKLWCHIISASGFLKRSIRKCKYSETSLAITEVSGDREEGLFIDRSYTILEYPTFRATKFEWPREWFDYDERDDDLVEAVGSCRGVVCFADMYHDQYVLWNPTTRRSRALANHDDRMRFGSSHVGIGYYNGEFKVVKISMSRSALRAYIYELSFDSWREISPIGINSERIEPENDNLTSWQNGRMCSWIAYMEADHENRTQECDVVSFDMASEAFTTSTFVFPVPYPEPYVCLCTLKDLLALCFYDGKGVDIWVFLQHCVPDPWAKLWTIPLSYGQEKLWPVEIWNGGLVVKSRSKRHLLWCDPTINSPWNIERLPVVASPTIPRGGGRSRVVAFKKTYAKLYPHRKQRETVVVKKAKVAAPCKKNPPKPFPEDAGLRDGRTYAVVLLSPRKKS